MQIFSETHLDILYTLHIPNLHCKDKQHIQTVPEQKYSQDILGPLR